MMIFEYVQTWEINPPKWQVKQEKSWSTMESLSAFQIAHIGLTFQHSWNGWKPHIRGPTVWFTPKTRGRFLHKYYSPFQRKTCWWHLSWWMVLQCDQQVLSSHCISPKILLMNGTSLQTCWYFSCISPFIIPHPCEASTSGCRCWDSQFSHWYGWQIKIVSHTLWVCQNSYWKWP